MGFAKNTGRDNALDIVRALCAVEIVAFWHLGNYLPDEIGYSSVVLHWGKHLTYGCLATFAYLSGFFLKKYTFKERGDVWKFYKKRINRFYYLYFIAVWTLYVGGLIVHESFFVDFFQVVMALLGLGEFFFPYPPTIWFFCMIIFFYLITPVVGKQKTKTNKMLMSLIIYLFLLLLEVLSIVSIDERLLIYYPFYFVALILPRSVIDYLQKWWIAIIALMLWIVIVSYISFPAMKGLVMVFFNSLFVIFILYLGYSLSKMDFLIRPFFFISYGSMTAYLFHRHFYLGFVWIMNLGSGISMRDAALWPWSIPIVVVVIFVASYFIQINYDKLMRLVQSKI